jgi:universal stress protein E
MGPLPLYRNILAAADFSPASKAALAQAIWLGRVTGGCVTLAHVVPDLRKSLHSASLDAKLDVLYGPGPGFFRELVTDAHRELDKMIAEASSPRPNVLPKALLGEPWIEICRAVKHAGYDLVLVGTRGLSGWKSFFLGSTARRLIRKCPAPVWVVKPEHVGPPRRILAATDFSETSRLAVLRGLQVARASQAEFHLLHVVDSVDVPDDVIERIPEGSNLRQQIHEAAQQHLTEFVASLPGDVEVRSQLTWGAPWEAIKEVSVELNVDLIVIGTVGRTGIAGMLLGNTAERVLGSCESSVLTVKPEGFESPVPLPVPSWVTV